MGVDSAKKERESDAEFVKVEFSFKLISGGRNKVLGVGKNRKINKQDDPLLGT